MSNYMNMTGCKAVIVDRDSKTTRSFSQPPTVVIPLPDRIEEKSAVMTPVRQMIRIACFKIA